MDQIFGMGINKNVQNLTEIGSATMGVSPKRGHPKFNLFTLLTWTCEIFKVSNYK